MGEFGIVTRRYCKARLRCCALCCFTFVQSRRSGCNTCSRLYSKYKC